MQPKTISTQRKKENCFLLEVPLTVEVAFRPTLKRWSNFPEQTMEVGVRQGYWDGRKSILGERKRFCSNKKVEEQGAGSGAMGLPFGQCVKVNKPRKADNLKSEGP